MTCPHPGCDLPEGHFGFAKPSGELPSGRLGITPSDHEPTMMDVVRERGRLPERPEEARTRLGTQDIVWCHVGDEWHRRSDSRLYGCAAWGGLWHCPEHAAQEPTQKRWRRLPVLGCGCPFDESWSDPLRKGEA